MTNNAAIYDKLAAQYDLRAESLRPGIESSINMFSRHLKKGIVLDVGCGVGLAMQILEESGLTPQGIDISKNMAKYAQKRNPNRLIMNADFINHRFLHKYDGLVAFAFIHLYTKNEANKILAKMFEILNSGGYLLIGTTKSMYSHEGFEVKADYTGNHKRFRKHWTKPELTKALNDAGFVMVESMIIDDPFGKTWMDFVVQKPQ